jgi:hypothetical protein
MDRGHEEGGEQLYLEYRSLAFKAIPVRKNIFIHIQKERVLDLLCHR